ncbi:MAG: histone deacetylase [Deltaproteobacteria bacterium]|nr:histone deacetylase [Nannocystaceae bacterium]
MSETLLLFDERMIEHDPGPGHPERPDRLRAIEAMLSLRTTSRSRIEQPRAATEEQIARVHTYDHIARVGELAGQYGSLDPDTHVSPDSVRAAVLAAGAATQAVDAVCGGTSDNAFALVRPPGHHAVANRAMGFCLFNNVAIAAAHARAVHGKRRVLLVDWDVHHGNGTEAIFFDTDEVLFFSSHQFPLYPGTGAAQIVGNGQGLGFTVNLPMQAGAGDGDYAMAFEQVLVPIAEAYAPDLVLVSAGFDAHRDDPLGGMEVSEEGFAVLCGIVQGIARRHCGGQMVLMLEGGYDLAGLAKSVHACIDVLNGSTPPARARSSSTRTEHDVRAAIERQQRFWTM